MKNVIVEKFDSIGQMLDTIESRPNNSIMKNCNSSIDPDYGFTLTHSYDEAVKLFRYGYTEPLKQIKNVLDKKIANTQIRNRRIVSTGVVGYTPHVPNAILGLPNSMINTTVVPHKTKAVSIVYAPTGNGGISALDLHKAGIALLSVINTMELNGVRVDLSICPKCSKEDDKEFAISMVRVKDYREHMDLQKLMFPVVHPSMFRRFGFKWLETCVGLTNSGWAYGYGGTIRSCAEVRQILKLDDKTKFINFYKIANLGYDEKEIIDFLNN